MIKQIFCFLAVTGLLYAGEKFIGETKNFNEEYLDDSIKNHIKANKETIDTKIKEVRKNLQNKVNGYKPKDLATLSQCSENKIWFNNMEWVNTEFPLKNYPIGTKVYPLKTINIPYKIFIINPTNKDELAWLKKQDYKSLYSRVWITQGEYFKIQKELNVPVFYLKENVQERIKLNCSPSLVFQNGEYFQINEYKIKKQGATK